MRARTAACCVALFASACTVSRPASVALTGDLGAFKSEILASQRAGKLSDAERVREVARAVARREIHTAQGSEAIERIQGLSGCADALENELEARTKSSDDVAAAATLVLLEAGDLDANELTARYGRSTSAGWREVAARAAVDTSQGRLRQAFFRDGDVKVRRAALRAARVARDATDFAELLEVARLDPDPLAKSLAVQVLAALGGERAVLGLKDLWPAADTTERLALVEAWAKPGNHALGGERELLHVLETESGLPGLRAALFLAAGDDANRALGHSAVLRALDQGSREERRLAIQLVDLHDPEFNKRVVESSADSDLQVRVAALARLAASTEHATRARDELLKLASGETTVTQQARAALVRVGDRRIEPLLLQELSASNSLKRAGAAIALFDVGAYSPAATALADDSPAVRLRVACHALGRHAATGTGAEKSTATTSITATASVDRPLATKPEHAAGSAPE